MLTIGMFYLTKKPIFTILMLQIAYLIQSGGGTGPMKPDNLHFARCQFRRVIDR